MDEQAATSDLFAHLQEPSDGVAKETSAKVPSLVSFVDAEPCQERHRLWIVS